LFLHFTRIILLSPRFLHFLKRFHFPKNLLRGILKPPRPLKGGMGMMPKIPRRGLTPTNQLPQKILKEKMKGGKESARRS
jgi:hypothetical protein